MAAIWQNDGGGWRLLAPAGFPDEAALHNAVEQAPNILPLSGSPRLIVVGREVQLGTGYADLLALEMSGRITILEIKLARNAEARRAVVAQVLAYAAFLKGLDAGTFEDLLRDRHLRPKGCKTLAEAIAMNDQEKAFDAAAFAHGLSVSLAEGRFRLVFVLDGAPAELVRLVGYLESISQRLIIDLITVSAYQLNGSQVLVPQRVDPGHLPNDTEAMTPLGKPHGRFVEGGDDFAASIERAPEKYRDILQRLYAWALELEKASMVKLGTYYGKTGLTTLLPRLLADDVGLVTIWNDNTAYLSLWRSVFDRRAPRSLPTVERILGKPVGQGNTTTHITEDLLDALTEAYREAAGKQLNLKQ